MHPILILLLALPISAQAREGLVSSQEGLAYAVADASLKAAPIVVAAAVVSWLALGRRHSRTLLVVTASIVLALLALHIIFPRVYLRFDPAPVWTPEAQLSDVTGFDSCVAFLRDRGRQFGRVGTAACVINAVRLVEDPYAPGEYPTYYHLACERSGACELDRLP